MKHAISISLGSSTRDKVVEVELLGQSVKIERIGTDGDIEQAKKMYQDLDGKIDAFGVGGIDLAIHTPWKNYPLHAGCKMVKGIQHTPCVDGGGLKVTLETQVMQYTEEKLGEKIFPKTAFLVSGITRSGMTESFFKAGYTCTIGDLMFALGIPIPLRRQKTIEIFGRLLLPLVGRLPISMLYPTGEKQLEITPKYKKYYHGNTVIAGDWLYIKQHFPEKMEGKVIVTNTTTEDDITFLSERGIKYLITTTPVMNGRSFGTNMLEAALVAVAGKGRPLTKVELEKMIAELGLLPQIQELT